MQNPQQDNAPKWQSAGDARQIRLTTARKRRKYKKCNATWRIDNEQSEEEPERQQRKTLQSAGRKGRRSENNGTIGLRACPKLKAFGKVLPCYTL